MDGHDYRRQYDSVMRGDDDDDNADVRPYDIKPTSGSLSTDSSYSKRLAEALGSDEGEEEEEEEKEGGATTSSHNDEMADEVTELGNGWHHAGETSIATEAGSTISTLSLRPVRPWQFPAPKRLRSLRAAADQSQMSLDSPSQILSGSASILSEEGSGRMSWMLPYGEPALNGTTQGYGTNGYTHFEGSAKRDDILRRSFLRMSRLCTLNDREGSPTVMTTAGGIVAVGTKEGKVGLFERGRGWTGVISVEGVVSALAISSDKTFVAVGTTLGHIFLYDINKTHSSARHVPPVAHQSVAQGRSEGHLQGSKILHLGFIGVRHTAVVSADDQGLCFYHSLGKILGVSSNDTLRILGRYPDLHDESKNKRSVCLSMAPLPLGATPHTSDSHQFVALLTPSKMVLVGLKPTPRTWYRSLSPEKKTAMPTCGSLAWLACTSQSSGSSIQSSMVHPTLAYSFGHQLRFMKLVTSGQSSAPQVVIQEEKHLSWTHTQPIEAMQWLSADYLALYSNGRMSLFDVRKGKCTEEQGTIKVVSNAWIEDSGPGTTLPFSVGSLKSYKGHLFVLAPSEVLAASLISWADRILALVSAGNFLGAIESTTSLLHNSSEEVGSRVGLPESFADQKTIVASRLMELMKASTKYVFSEDRMKDDMSTQRGGVDRTPLFEGLARVCAEACLALDDFSFLFDELFDVYSEAGIEAIFADQMETFIVNGQLNVLPLPVVQRLISIREKQGRYDLAERIIWNVDPACLDLDQTIHLCLDNRLYDALIYLYTRALHDYVGPIVELMPLLRQHDGEAYRIMSYLSITLIGLSYPNQEKLEEKEADLARSSLYSFLFSGRCIIWPEGLGGKLVLTRGDQDEFDEPTYPYLSLMLQFDAEAFLDALDIAFEDAWLEEGDTNRQMLVSTLFQMVESQQEGRIFVAIFLARNAPKYPQFIKLTSSQVELLLSALSTPQDEEDGDVDKASLEDREYAVECLLGAYRPPQTDKMLEQFERAGFLNILRRIYRSVGKWNKLAQMIVAGPHNESTLDGVNEVLKKGSKDAQVQSIILHSLPALVDVDVKRIVAINQRYMPLRQNEAVRHLTRSPHRQLTYLKELLLHSDSREGKIKIDGEISNLYISLLCSLEPHSLISTLDERGPAYFNLHHVVEVTREEGVMDALLWARDRLDETSDAFVEMDQFIAERGLILRNVDLDDSVGVQEEDEVTEAKEQLRNVVDMSIRICSERQREELWMQLLRIVIHLTHDLRDLPALAFSQTLLEDTLSSFVSSATADQVSFSSLFKRLVADEKGSTYAEVRVISDGMMAANRLREELLSITNRLFDRDIHREMVGLISKQRVGWRPASVGSVCSGCGQACIGMADARAKDEERHKSKRRRQSLRLSTGPSSPYLDRGVSPRPDKGKGVVRGDEAADMSADSGFFSSSSYTTDPIDVFSTTPIVAPRAGADESHLFDEDVPSEGGEEEEEAGEEESVIVFTNGAIWHRLCTPPALLNNDTL